MVCKKALMMKFAVSPNLMSFSAFQGKVDESYLCSKLALTMLEKYQGSEWQGRVSFSIYAFIFPLKRPLRESLGPLYEGHRAGLLCGDISVSKDTLSRDRY
jgi:hypothetical protein